MGMVQLQFSADASISTHEKDGVATIKGMAAPYGVPSRSYKRYKGQLIKLEFERDAFKGIEGDKGVWLCYGHNNKEILGRNTVNMSLTNRQEGLFLEAALNPEENDLTRRAISYVRQGFVDGFSVGARVKDPKRVYDHEGDNCFVFSEARLEEISIVPNPGFGGTGVEVAMSHEDVNEGIEKWLVALGRGGAPEPEQVSRFLF